MCILFLIYLFKQGDHMMIRLAVLLIIVSTYQNAYSAMFKCEKEGEKIVYQATPCSNGRQSEVKVQHPAQTQTVALPDAKKQCVDKELSINFSNMPVSNVLSVIADFSGKRLSISQPIIGSGAFHYDCVPWDSVLFDIASKFQIAIRIENETIFVRPR